MRIHTAQSTSTRRTVVDGQKVRVATAHHVQFNTLTDTLILDVYIETVGGHFVFTLQTHACAHARPLAVVEQRSVQASAH